MSVSFIQLSLTHPDGVFVRKLNPLLGLGNWQSAIDGVTAYGKTKREAIENVREMIAAYPWASEGDKYDEYEVV